MAHRHAVVGGALVVAAAAVWLGGRGEVAPPALADEAAAAGAEPMAARAAPPAPLAAAAVRAEADRHWWLRHESDRAAASLRPQPGEPTIALQGRLTVRQRPWLHPAGVTVRVTNGWLDTMVPTEVGEPDGTPPVPSADEPEVRTDADGAFALTCRVPPGELFLLIDHGGVWSDYQRLAVVPLPGGTADLGEVWLDDRGEITGTVVDAGGRGVAGAAVRAVDEPLARPDSGLDELHAVRQAAAFGFAAAGSLRSGPLPDWVVRRDRWLPFPGARTDAAGRFRIRGLRPGPQALFVQAEGVHGGLAGVQVQPQRATEVGNVRLQNGEPVALRFVDEVGRPWVGASVAMVATHSGFGGPVVKTDADGRIAAVVPQLLGRQLCFAAPGGGPWLDLGSLVLAALGPDRIEVPRAAPVRIALVDAAGRPVAGGEVRLYVAAPAFRPRDRALPEALQPQEQEPGTYVGRAPGPVVAVASARGFAPAIAAVDGDAVLTLLPLQQATVFVRDAEGRPIAAAAVRLQAHQHPEQTFPGAQWDLLANDRAFAGTTGEDGKLTVPVWPTFLSFQASHPDFADSPGPKLVPRDGQTVELLLRRGARLGGRLLLQQRPAPAGFRVRARQEPPPGHALAGSGWLAEQVAVTDAEGRFALRGLVAGLWTVQPELPPVPAAGGAQPAPPRFRSVAVLLEEDQQVWREIEALDAPLTAPQLVGAVRRDGLPLAGAVVRLRPLAAAPARPAEAAGSRSRRRDARRPRAPAPAPRPAEPDGGYTHRLTTDHFGDFAFGDLPPGQECELRIDLPWQDRLQFLERRVVAVPLAGGPLRVEIAVQTGSLRLHCVDAGQQPYANRMLRLRQVGADGAEAARFEVLTEAGGECALEGLPVGTWTIEPMFGGRCDPAELRVAAGAAAATIRVTDR